MLSFSWRPACQPVGMNLFFCNGQKTHTKRHNLFFFLKWKNKNNGWHFPQNWDGPVKPTKLSNGPLKMGTKTRRNNQSRIPLVCVCVYALHFQDWHFNRVYSPHFDCLGCPLLVACHLICVPDTFLPLLRGLWAVSVPVRTKCCRSALC